MTIQSYEEGAAKFKDLLETSTEELMEQHNARSEFFKKIYSDRTTDPAIRSSVVYAHIVLEEMHERDLSRNKYIHGVMAILEMREGMGTAYSDKIATEHLNFSINSLKESERAYGIAEKLYLADNNGASPSSQFKDASIESKVKYFDLAQELVHRGGRLRYDLFEGESPEELMTQARGAIAHKQWKRNLFSSDLDKFVVPDLKKVGLSELRDEGYLSPGSETFPGMDKVLASNAYRASGTVLEEMLNSAIDYKKAKEVDADTTFESLRTNPTEPLISSATDHMSTTAANPAPAGKKPILPTTGS
ncbi:MAG: hypothetical protein FWE53_03130 [Firmicutes bacterium]|nr:hypothetical protein [Bacillota bacterium]